MNDKMPINFSNDSFSIFYLIFHCIATCDCTSLVSSKNKKTKYMEHYKHYIVLFLLFQEQIVSVHYHKEFQKLILNV